MKPGCLHSHDYVPDVSCSFLLEYLLVVDHLEQTLQYRPLACSWSIYLNSMKGYFSLLCRNVFMQSDWLPEIYGSLLQAQGLPLCPCFQYVRNAHAALGFSSRKYGMLSSSRCTASICSRLTTSRNCSTHKSTPVRTMVIEVSAHRYFPHANLITCRSDYLPSPLAVTSQVNELNII